MSETKFTPAPWSIERGHSRITVLDMGGDLVASVGNGPYWESYGTVDEANAHLIAAAPALYALVERYRRETPLGHQPHMIAGEADAALSQARGEK